MALCTKFVGMAEVFFFYMVLSHDVIFQQDTGHRARMEQKNRGPGTSLVVLISKTVFYSS